MKIIHFDVDYHINQYLRDQKYSFSLQDIPEKEKLALAQAEAITLKSNSHATNSTLSLFSHLQLIVTRTVGIDHIALEECKKRRIAVYHVVDYGAFNIAEQVFALLLAGTRHIVDSQREVKLGRFSYHNYLSFTLKDKTLGVVGTGRIGLEVVKLAKAFGMKIIAYDIYQNTKAAAELGYRYVALDELLAQSDVITLHAPAMKETKHLINVSAIGKMKKGVVLINTARGALIDTAALIKNIKKFRFVGLDVLEDEAGFDKNHPLLKSENVIITPHIAFFTDASVQTIAQETYRCIENFEKGSREGRAG
ncbi:hypothetical protein A2966_02970 [Candidatus Roizmanbacteria bacterium RIFCSPLOWO2_01_FULL_41_22]|uniref:Hydroxyacid dehydrogenase n=1 Tax=Candidatus Roizmanbacteria bacterium RIFCSPLOWO2_01_FULL_41_22 TaxID=1802067 RepID=A0A1F7J7L5_9BACT|nr:MAG: hypothetical protein A2966_02970 [Candidatus Roizmanbacteria bacterium RIFCSPLOWO2_01_FULL_41_22]